MKNIILIISAFIFQNASCGNKEFEYEPSKSSKIDMVIHYDFSKDGYETAEYSIIDSDSVKKVWSILNLRSGESLRGVKVIDMEAILDVSFVDENEVTQFYRVYYHSDHGTFVDKFTGKEVQVLIRSEMNKEIEKFLDLDFRRRGIHITTLDE